MISKLTESGQITNFGSNFVKFPKKVILDQITSFRSYFVKFQIRGQFGSNYKFELISGQIKNLRSNHRKFRIRGRLESNNKFGVILDQISNLDSYWVKFSICGHSGSVFTLIVKKENNIPEWLSWGHKRSGIPKNRSNFQY